MGSATGGSAVVEFTTVAAGLLDAVDYAGVALLPDREQLETVAELLLGAVPVGRCGTHGARPRGPG